MVPRVLLAAAVGGIILFGIGVAFALGYLPGNRDNEVIASHQTYFTIIMSNTGFNGSANQPGTWPVMKVAKGETITIRIINNDPVESHGLAIAHYFDGDAALRPHEFHDIVFVADQTGAFRVYCNIFCAIPPLMQTGQLVVSP